MWVQNPRTSILMRRQKRTEETQKSRQCEEDRNGSDVSTSQEMPQTASSHQKLGGRHGTILPQSLQKKPALQTP